MYVKITDSYLLWEAVVNRAIHDTFLSLKKVKKRVYGNYGSLFACDLEKCPRSLYMPLLRNHLFSTYAQLSKKPTFLLHVFE